MRGGYISPNPFAKKLQQIYNNNNNNSDNNKNNKKGIKNRITTH